MLRNNADAHISSLGYLWLNSGNSWVWDMKGFADLQIRNIFVLL